MQEIYVGNLNFATDEQALSELFSQFGQVERVSMITDRETGRPRGFAFVTMANDEDAKEAISSLDGKEFDGRTLRVNEARGKNNKPRGGGGRGDGGGRHGGTRPDEW